MPDTATTIWVKIALPGFHHWPSAPPHRAYLASPHRHLFVIRVQVAVSHDDRNIEFHDLHDTIRDWWGAPPRFCGPASCETLARQLGDYLTDRHHRVVSVDISEDDECGATITYPTHQQKRTAMEISREFTFEAAHRLPNVPTGHKCGKPHGHSYRVTLHVSGVVDPDTGWVMDFATITTAFAPLLQQLDHQYLNEVPGLENPTSENLSRWLWSRLADHLPLAGIEVHETAASGCVYRGEDPAQ